MRILVNEARRIFVAHTVSGTIAKCCRSSRPSTHGAPTQHGLILSEPSPISRMAVRTGFYVGAGQVLGNFPYRLGLLAHIMEHPYDFSFGFK